MGKKLKTAIVLALVMLSITLAIGGVRAQINSTSPITPPNSTDQVQQQFQSTISNWLSFFQTNINWLSSAFLGFLKNVIEATYFTLGLVGFVLWVTGISKYTGKRLLIGAIALALVAQIFL